MNTDLADRSDQNHEYRGPSQLFLLRVWQDDARNENDWHGRVQHAVTGEAHYFQSCAELRCIIRDMLAETKLDQLIDEQ
jgi:hypothetical protein